MGDAFDIAVQADFAVFAHGKRQLIAVVEKLEEGFQQVVAIVAATKNVQHQVELGRGRQGQLGHISAPAGAAASP